MAANPNTVATQADRAFEDLARAARDGDHAGFSAALARHGQALRHYLETFAVDNAPSGLTERYIGDAFARFLHTLEFVPLPAPPRILEIGSNPYFFRLLLTRIFPQSEIVGANFFERNIFSTHQGSLSQRLESTRLGERYDFDSVLANLDWAPVLPLPRDHFDLVFFCETLEHLIADPLGSFRRLRRVLRPGGHLLITLPNAVRLTNVALMLAGRNLFDLYHPETGVHGRHNREFTLAEVCELVRGEGFDIVRRETRDRFDYDRVPIMTYDYTGPSRPLAWNGKTVRAALRKVGGSLDDRGDNLYVLARRDQSASDQDSTARLHVDVVEDLGDAVRVGGWGFVGERTDLRLVFHGPGGSVAVTPERRSRADVAVAHRLAFADVGFDQTIDKKGLPAGRNRLTLEIEDAAGETHVFETSHYIEVS